MPERHRGDAGAETGFTAAAGQVRVAVDEPGQQALPLQVDFCRAGTCQRVPVIADSQDLATTSQDMPKT